MPLGLDFKSLVVGILLGYLVLGKLLDAIQAKMA